MSSPSSPLALYSTLLSLETLPAAQLQALQQPQTSAIIKSLLKLESSRRTTPAPAHCPHSIGQLKLARSYLSEFLRTAPEHSDQKHMYTQVMVGVLAHMLNWLLLGGKYAEVAPVLQELLGWVRTGDCLRQAVYGLFGVESLLPLRNYSLEGNTEYSYSTEAQLWFLFMVGRVKMAANKFREAETAFKRVLELSKFDKFNAYLMMRVLEHLEEIDSGRYYVELEQNRRQFGEWAMTRDEKRVTGEVLSRVLEKQLEISRKNGQEGAAEGLEGRGGRLVVYLLLRKSISTNQEIKKQAKMQYYKALQVFKNEKNPIVLEQVIKSLKIDEVQESYVKVLQKAEKIIIKMYLNKLKQTSPVPPSNVVYKPKSIIASSSSKMTLSNGPKSQRFPDKIPRNLPRNTAKAQQILRICQVGSYLMKINYGNTSISRKFVQIQPKQLAWAQDRSQIESSGSGCKWKHITGIVYGKVTKNLTKQDFQHLEPWRCFSLIYQDRSYDFYCQNEADIFLWLQGLSYHLQAFNKKPDQNARPQRFPYYSKGRALWKMALLKMSQYRNPSRKYRNANVGAVLGFRNKSLNLKPTSK